MAKTSRNIDTKGAAVVLGMGAQGDARTIIEGNRDVFKVETQLRRGTREQRAATEAN